MKRLCLILTLMAFALTGFAQKQKKWEPPKRPKPVKWNPAKPVAPEVINVWRPYTMSDNWYTEVYGGVSISMAENMGGHSFWKMCRPSFDVSIGRQFSYLWGTRFSLGYRTQRGWASKEALAAELERHREELPEEAFAILERFISFFDSCTDSRLDMPEGTIVTVPYYAAPNRAVEMKAAQ